jgi:hypothetical protein
MRAIKGNIGAIGYFAEAVLFRRNALLEKVMLEHRSHERMIFPFG